MKNELKSKTVKQISEMDKYNVDSNNRDSNHNGRTSDTYPYENVSEAKLTIFGHAFTMSELYAISTFINQLHSTSTELLNADQSIPSGSVFIMKVINHEIDVSFGGFLKK
jgi:hypothetical protein